MLISQQLGMARNLTHEVVTKVPSLVHLCDMDAMRLHASFAGFWRFLRAKVFDHFSRMHMFALLPLSACAEAEVRVVCRGRMYTITMCYSM